MWKNALQAAITLHGGISVSPDNRSGMLYANGEAHFAANYLIQPVDRVVGGSGSGRVQR